MAALPFAEAELDLIWSEGAIYNIGFARGIRAWRPLLRPGGVLVASEITWTGAQRPAEVTAHWQREYPEIDVASAKLAQLEQAGYTPIGYFVLPEHCWLDHYYRPLQAGFEAFLARHGHAPAAQSIVAAERAEIALYQAYRAHYSYGVYVARRPDAGGA
jgi:SAM-dependent methyltransferase